MVYMEYKAVMESENFFWPSSAELRLRKPLSGRTGLMKAIWFTRD